jgi:hypothetical protein
VTSLQYPCSLPPQDTVMRSSLVSSLSVLRPFGNAVLSVGVVVCVRAWYLGKAHVPPNRTSAQMQI